MQGERQKRSCNKRAMGDVAVTARCAMIFLIEASRSGGASMSEDGLVVQRGLAVFTRDLSAHGKMEEALDIFTVALAEIS
jgi:hypothetical protein